MESVVIGCIGVIVILWIDFFLSDRSVTLLSVCPWDRLFCEEYNCINKT